jgi:polyribonucleotide nucleotidyltransferase
VIDVGKVVRFNQEFDSLGKEQRLKAWAAMTEEERRAALEVLESESEIKLEDARDRLERERVKARVERLKDGARRRHVLANMTRELGVDHPKMVEMRKLLAEREAS